MSQATMPNTDWRSAERRFSPTIRRLAGQAAKHALLIAVSIVFLVPFYWMVTSALKDNNQIFAFEPTWWPNPVVWENFPTAINFPGFPYLRLLGNSIFYAGAVTIGTIFSCAAIAYGFARLRFPGRDLLFGITLATLMIPPIVTFIPTYILFAATGLNGTYAPLIIPRFLGDAFYIFMLRQFFKGIPADLSDAARIDGAGEFRIFWEIMLPLVRPALIVVAVFSILYTWHDFFGPLIYLQDPMSYPLSLGLYAFRSQRAMEWALIMTASVLTVLPLILVFLFTQRYFIRGVAMTGLKG
jgi:multiple sugar transport system permease protein